MRINSTLFVRNLSLLPGPISPPFLSCADYKPANTTLLSTALQDDDLLIMEQSGNKARPDIRPVIMRSMQQQASRAFLDANRKIQRNYEAIY